MVGPCTILFMKLIIGRGFFAWISASMQHSIETMSLWLCWRVKEVQVALVAAFSTSDAPHLPLDKIPDQHRGLGRISLQHLHKATQQMQACEKAH